MTVQLRKVDGGWEVFIPDEMANLVGFREGVPLQSEVMAEMLMIQQPELVQAARDAMFARITPEMLPDPRSSYDPPVGYERAG